MSKKIGRVPTKPSKPASGLPPWTPFERAEMTKQQIKLLVAIGGEESIPDEVWVNSRYQVLVTYYKPGEFMAEDDMPYPYVSHLSIKRRDRQPVTDWRDKQRLKNEILGDEIEAVEVYPAESRLVDSSNQYHLFALPPGHRFSFGYKSRGVGLTAVIGGAVQRPFEPGTEPSDVQDVDARIKDALRRLSHAQQKDRE